jgi:hypothetical protein
MGPTIEVRGMGPPGSLEAAIVTTLNKAAATLDEIVDKVNTANGGTTGLPIVLSDPPGLISTITG